MQVFKLYYKLFLRSSIVTTIMYLVIFSFITLKFSQTSSDPTEQIFNLETCRVAIIDNDKSLLSEGLSNYIKENSIYVELSDTSKDGIKDALFFRNAEYIIIIPDNFGEKLFTDDKIMLQTMRIPNSSSGMYLDTMINKYLNTAKLYVKADINLEETLKKLSEDLSIETNVRFADGEKTVSMPSFLYYFNYLVYPLISISVLSISGTTLIINETYIKRRNLSSPISTNKFSLSLFLANLSMALVMYVIFLGIAFVMFTESLLTQAGMLTIINGLIFTILSLSLCFLISNFVSNKTITPISTVLSLLMCFTGGVFVPQQYLSESLKNVAVINPAFWYVKANNILGSISVFNTQTLKPVAFAMIVQICFAIAFLAISLVIVKQKSTSES
jgi:ABC-2 type transport system permease protein